MLALLAIVAQAAPANQPAATRGPARASSLPATKPPPLVPATFQIRRTLAEGSTATTALDAATLALADAEQLGHRARCAWYVWVPDHIYPASGFAQVSLAVNSTLTRTPNIIQPVPIAEGRILRIDIDRLAGDESQVDALLRLREATAKFDTVFNDEHHHGPAHYLGETGRRLFDVARSCVPILRLDEFVAATFSTVNGGQYYQLAGISGTLEQVIREHCGNDAADKVKRATATMREAASESQRTGEPIAKIAARLDPELTKSKCYVGMSGVTGRQRLVLALHGTNISPSIGTQYILLTFDIAEGNVDPESDPLRNPLTFERYDGGEGIWIDANGTLRYIVYDAQDKVIASVPDNVASDSAALKVRSNVATTRVFSGLSCANCHEQGDKSMGWQPLPGSRIAERRLYSVLDDNSQRDRLQALQRYASQYSGDLNTLLDQARVIYQHQSQLATRQTSTKETIAGLADSYWGYLYDPITPRVALMELTGEVTSDKWAADRLLEIFKGVPFDAEHEEVDTIAGELADGISVAPGQWRVVYQKFAECVELHAEGVKP